MSSDSYGQGVQIADLTGAPNANTLAFNIVDALTPRSVMRFASTTARNATLTSPVAGMTAYLSTEKTYTVYDGTQWVALVTAPGAWVTFTPTWTATTVNPSVGNGTLIGAYSLFGRTCDVHIDLTMGSSTNYGSGNWQFALPFTAVSGKGSRVGHAHALGTSNNGRYAGQNIVSPGATTTSPFFPDSAGDSQLFFAKNDTPFNWAVGYQLRISFTYEIA
ncbi:hypothetical protein ACFWMG_04550 [Streptomyces sp. NPDC127074]|uniref:hypothetical protein n=1 Tax=Streptomyces sp. NPDC127074 TaxID=3347130 RepID=UPI0036509CC9